MRCWNSKVIYRSANNTSVQNFDCKLLKAPYTERYVLVLWEGEAVRDRQLYPINNVNQQHITLNYSKRYMVRFISDMELRALATRKSDNGALYCLVRRSFSIKRGNWDYIENVKT